MAFLGGLLGGLGGSGTGSIFMLLVYIILGIIVMGGIATGFFLIYHNKKKWFIHVEVKIPRADGRIINSEVARGTYDAKRGVVFIKRNRKRPVPLKPFDVKKYLQGGSKETLTVVQVGIEDYRPVLINSYLEMVDSETGEEAALMKIKIDTTESKAWKESFEREAKNAYSLQTFLQQHGQILAFGILFFMIFIGFAILYGRIKPG